MLDISESFPRCDGHIHRKKLPAVTDVARDELFFRERDVKLESISPSHMVIEEDL